MSAATVMIGLKPIFRAAGSVGVIAERADGPFESAQDEEAVDALR